MAEQDLAIEVVAKRGPVGRDVSHVVWVVTITSSAGTGELGGGAADDPELRAANERTVDRSKVKKPLYSNQTSPSRVFMMWILRPGRIGLFAVL